MTEGLHHFHLRKRIHQRHEPYPHPDKLKRFMDKAIYFVGIFGSVMTLPQVARIWLGQNAAGVSIISWSSYLAVAIFWLAYGIVHREKPIIFTFGLYILLDALVVIGILLHGGEIC